MTVARSRADRCPGTSRPWPADDGLLVRLRLVAGRVTAASLQSLMDVAEQFADGRIYLTSRANLQVRGFASTDGRLTPQQQAALAATGLVPSQTHELARNIMASPTTGCPGGRADVAALCREVDRLICIDHRLAELPGRFLFVIDDGRGDLIGRSCDLGLVALDDRNGQLRVGQHFSAVVALSDAPARLTELAAQFVHERGTGASAAWHVAELPRPLVPPAPGDARLPASADPLPFGPVEYGDSIVGHHWAVPEKGLDRQSLVDIVGQAAEVVITPWRGVFLRV